MSWYAGSQPDSQRVVGRLNRSVQIADERMGFVQARQIEVCLAEGWPAAPYAPADARVIRARRRARNATLAPPPPTTVAGCQSEIFLTFSSKRIFPTFP